MENMFQAFTTLTREIFECIALGLDLPSRDTFLQFHKHIGEVSKNSTLLRTMHYPSFSESDYQENVTRCAPHTDFGTISFMFQDDVGGLEVDPNLGRFIPATAIKDAIVVLVADVLPMWAGSGIKPTVTAPDNSTVGFRTLKLSIIFGMFFIAETSCHCSEQNCWCQGSSEYYLFR